MTRPLRGLRYQPDPFGPKAWLTAFVRDEVQHLSLAQVNAFYKSLTDPAAQERRRAKGRGHDITLKDWAFLGCNDRYFLLTRLCGRKKDMFDDLSAEHAAWLYDRCREVEADPDGHIDLWARMHYKSSLITFGGNVQDIICDPEIKIAIFSVTKQIAWEFLAQIKTEFENNMVLRAVYPDVLYRNPRKKDPVEGRPSKWSIARGITVKRKGNPKEATIEAHGLIDGQPTSRHYDKHCYDDIVTQDYLSPEQLKKTLLRYEMADNLGTHEGARKQIAGTIYHHADAYCVIMEERRGGLIPRIYPATDDGTLNGKPVFLTSEAWEKAKSAQRSTVSAQMLLDPVAGDSQMFLVAWNRPYEVRPSLLNVYITGDPSLGKNKTSDRTAIAVTGVDTLNNKYLLDGFVHRMPQSARWAALKELYKKWSAMPGVQSINVGWERYGMHTDKEYFEERMREEKDAPSFNIKELNWVAEGGQSKPKRVERLEPEFRDGRFFLPALVWNPEITLRAADFGGNVEGLVEVRKGEYRHPDGLCTWKIGKSRDLRNKAQVILYTPFRESTKAMRAVDALGQPYRKAAAIKRVEKSGEGDNQQATIYDVTRMLFHEMRRFPFADRDDLVDALSRYNDMEPTPPLTIEEAAAAAPHVYSDGP